MQKEMDAKYYDAVVKHDRRHASRWVEVGRRGNVVILGKVQDVKQQIPDDSARLAVSDLRESEQPTGKGMHTQPADSGGSVGGNHPKRRGRPRKERSL